MAKNKKEINKEEADYNKYIYKINETLNVLKDESSELEKFSNNLSNKTFDGIKDILKIKSNGFFDINDTLLNLIDLLKGQNKTYRNNLLKDEKQQLDKETDNLRLEQRKLDSLKQKYEKLCDVTQEIDDNSYTGNTELKILVEKLEDVIRNQKKEIDTYELLKYEYGISTITQLDQIIKDKDSTLAYKDEKICKSENEIAELKSSINVKVEDSKEYKELCKINSNLNKAYKNKECESDIKLLAAIEKQKVEIDKVKSINNKLQIELDSFIKPQTLDAKSQRRILDSYTRIQIPKTTIIKSGITELSWIENIQNGIKNYEFDFPWRLIYAFHTSLKVCEINPLTVLTGVSGTGKSELPRLYAHFGGLNFINIPVQPNWDSLDSMMGYYDPIDKKFLSTELFNFLISIREKNNDSVSIVLLDEMNLSHLELYFAEFLSKLEARRGSIKLPEINFKLVSNMDYHLPLENNMLWVGTMNYDETTKNLSDKVIDRGEIITFPRPSKLVDRNCNIVLPKESPLIDKKIYKGWSENYHDELCENALIKYNQNIDRYSKIVGTIENSLSYINRAIGQRVWQATTNYIKYYPLVIDALKNGSDDKIDKAMDIAFEDQFVQKIIPKLKGIETEGYSREKCLNVVMEQLKEFNKGSLERDFKKALNSSYGQFNWVSSEYLQNENNESIEYFKNMN